MSDEAELMFIEAQQNSVKQGFFRRANPTKAIQCYEKAGNLFKIKKNYERAGQSFYEAAKLQISQREESSATINIRNSLQCFNLCHSEQATDVLNLMIETSLKSGNFIQAAKSLIQQADQYNKENTTESDKLALTTYYKALDILQSETNVDSDIRKVQENIAYLEVKINKDFIKAKDIYENIAIGCVNTRILQFHARAYYLKAFLCVMHLDDEIAAQQSQQQYFNLDPNLEGSPVGDFMVDLVKCIQNGSKQTEFDQAYSKYMIRENIRGDQELRNLIFYARETMKDLETEKQVKSVEQVEQLSQNCQQDDDVDLL